MPLKLPTLRISTMRKISRLNVHHALHSSGLEPQDVHLYVTLPLSQFYTALGETNDVKHPTEKRQPDEAG